MPDKILSFVLLGLLIIAAVVAIIAVHLLSRQKQMIRREKAIKKETDRRRRVTQSVKKEVLERDDYTCQICGISAGFVRNLCPGLEEYLLLEVDHIQSVAEGGTGKDSDNLQCLCWRCNRKKGGKKTNDDVKAIIDYGIDKLKKELPV